MTVSVKAGQLGQMSPPEHCFKEVLPRLIALSFTDGKRKENYSISMYVTIGTILNITHHHLLIMSTPFAGHLFILVTNPTLYYIVVIFLRISRIHYINSYSNIYLYETKKEISSHGLSCRWLDSKKIQ